MNAEGVRSTVAPLREQDVFNGGNDMNKLWKASALLAGAMFAAAPVTTMAADEIDFMVVDYDAPGMGEWWHLLVDTYNSNSGYTVVPRNTPASEYYSQLTIQAASGAAADVVIVNPNNLGEMLAGKLVMPLTDKIKAAGLEDMIVEGGFDALSKDGEIYALPVTGRTLELIYNACYFEEVGFSARRPRRRNSSTTPESWSCATTGAV